jgi:Acetyltransferase (GNAT) domain
LISFGRLAKKTREVFGLFAKSLKYQHYQSHRGGRTGNAGQMRGLRDEQAAKCGCNSSGFCISSRAMSGYLSRAYADSLVELGCSRYLPRCRGWILERPVDMSAHRDAVGGYPLFSCESWRGLAADLADLQHELVSLVLVADPFGAFDVETLNRSFNAGVSILKRHHVVELVRPVDELACPHHKRNARKALEHLVVEHVDSPALFLNEWADLYDVLIRRHNIRGVARFSRESFKRQFEVPGLVAFRAQAAGETVGMLLWYVQGDSAYYHLGAYSDLGYELKASFALFWRAIEWFSGKLSRLDLGAGAGLGHGSGGLDRFKQGWATQTRVAYLCRHVFQPELYERLVASTGTHKAPFFPAYRWFEQVATARPLDHTA